MKRTSIPLLLLPIVAAGCAEQQDQALPFDVEPTAVTRTVPVAGGIVSSPAGASVAFPAGSFSGDQSVTLTPGAVPAALAASGRAISAHAFSVEASGRLGAPARAEVAFRPSGDSTWLATLASVSSAGVAEYADTRVDVASGIATASIGALGTVAVVIPHADAVFALSVPGLAPASGASGSAAAQRLVGADSLLVRCGGPGDRCDGLSIGVSDNLLGRVRRAAVVYPALEGTLRVQNGEIVGTVALSAGFRAELAAGQIAENVVIDESFHFRVPVASNGLASALSRSAAGSAAEGATLHIPESGSPSATVRHELLIPNASGGMEPASISITFPFEIHQ